MHGEFATILYLSTGTRVLSIWRPVENPNMATLSKVSSQDAFHGVVDQVALKNVGPLIGME